MLIYSHVSNLGTGFKSWSGSVLSMTSVSHGYMKNLCVFLLLLVRFCVWGGVKIKCVIHRKWHRVQF